VPLYCLATVRSTLEAIAKSLLSESYSPKGVSSATLHVATGDISPAAADRMRPFKSLLLASRSRTQVCIVSMGDEGNISLAVEHPACSRYYLHSFSWWLSSKFL